MLRLTAATMVALLFPAAAGVEAAFRIAQSPRAAIAPADSAQVRLAMSLRLTEAALYLNAGEGVRLHPRESTIHITMDRVVDESGPIPVSYTFPDSMIRVAPEFAGPLSNGAALEFLRDVVPFSEPLDGILARCTPEQMEFAPHVVRDFVISEFVHELYHDCQNRAARFRTVDRARAALTAARGAFGTDWRTYLASRGFDMRRHDRELGVAEYEATAVQRRFWISRYGSCPEHPLARAILALMDDARLSYPSSLADF